MPGDTDIDRPGSGSGRRNGDAPRPWLQDRPGGAPPSGEWPRGTDTRRDRGDGESGYYDVPMLKPPVWTVEIETYFFLGGLSAGAFILSRLAERLGGGQAAYRDLSKAGGVVAALSVLPCAPLLIADLGDPTRFLHMLRVFKPSSPMNFGSWVLTGYSPLAVLVGLREWARTEPDGALGWAKALLRAADPAVRLASDVAGIPLALMLAGYTGVLLSATATPVWSKNPYLGALFSAGALSAGTSAVSLAFEATHRPGDGSEADEAAATEAVTTALARIGTTAHAAEAATLAGYLKEAGEFAEPLTKGPLAAALWGGVVAAGIALPEVLELLPVPQKTRRWVRMAGSVAGLVGGFFLRRAITRAGVPSANDPEYARRATRARRVTDPDDEHGAGVANSGE